MSNAVNLKHEELEMNQYEGLDHEWVYLLMVAKKMGITPQEIRESLFIN